MRLLRSSCSLIAVAGLLAGAVAASATAATPSPAWDLHVDSQPTLISPSKGGNIVALVTNSGAVASGAGTPVVVTVALPPNLAATEGRMTLSPYGQGNGGCVVGGAGRLVRCTYAGSLASDDTEGINVTVPVSVSEPTASSATATVSVAGGETPGATATVQAGVSAGEPPFGPSGFELESLGVDGLPDVQAGGHPNALSVFVDFNNVDDTSSGVEVLHSVKPIDDVVTDLPLGLIGNPQAAVKCPQYKIKEANALNEPNCPAGSIVGTVAFSSTEHAEYELSGNVQVAPLYDLVPQGGYPAEFAFDYLATPGTIFASVVHTNAGYVLRTTVAGVPIAAGFKGALLTFFGDPGVQDAQGTPSAAFFTNPVSCAGGGSATLATTTFAEPFSPPVERQSPFPAMTGCEKLHFEPVVEARPEQTQTDSPTGLTFTLKVPQNEDPAGLASADLKNAAVTLPAGMSLSPSAANGLQGCAAEGAQGFNAGHDWNAEGVSPGDPDATDLNADGVPQVAPGHCPLASQIATVKVKTPLLTSPLEGHLYLASPRCGGAGQPACTEASATNGDLYRLYLEVEGSGVVLKLEGKVAANPQTGQLQIAFDEAPELPFSELQIVTNGGQRAPLVTPSSCSTYTTTSDLTPWSSPETPDATPLGPFAITEGCGARGFAPAFSAGTTNTQAGAYSPFTLTFSRGDGDQDFSAIEQTLPPGLLAKLAGVAQCGNAQANAGTCSQSSEIGTVTVGAGPGSDPYYVQGHIYLTGPYNGGPFGEVVEVPAVAGPFNLGTVVVRGAIRIDRTTAQATVVSNPFPTILDGIPLQVRTVNVTLNRPGFTFNPTSCAPAAVTGAIASTQGASANVSTPFAAANCAGLPFKPVFSAATAGKASKAGGASLTVKVTSKGGPQAGGGEANIKSVKVDLPKQLPSRLSTLQKACLAKVFEADPASCPKESDVGTATASTPVLAGVGGNLSGPAYLVSHGGAAFPDLEIVLQGEGVELILDGNTDIKKGITSSTFKTVPDAPISSFELKLPTGKFSVLSTDLPEKAKYNFCGQALSMPTAITGQNGTVVKQTTKLAVTGCPKSKKIKHKQQKQQANQVTKRRGK